MKEKEVLKIEKIFSTFNKHLNVNDFDIEENEKFCNKKLDAIDPLAINDYKILLKLERSIFTNGQLFTLSRIL